MTKEIHVSTDKGEFIIREIHARRQFLNKLGLEFQDTERIYDWRERNRILSEALDKRTQLEVQGKVKPLVFRCFSDTNIVNSVVSTEYVEVPIIIVKYNFTLSLKELGFTHEETKEWEDSGVHFCLYKILKNNEPLTFKIQENVFSCNILLRIGFSGDRSISFLPSWRVHGFYPLSIVSSKPVYLFRQVHRYLSRNEILEKMKSSLNLVFKELESFKVLVESSCKPVPVDDLIKVLERTIEKYPLHVREQVKKAFVSECWLFDGLWRVSQTLSFVAENYKNLSENYRLQLMKDSYKVLESK